MRRTSITIHLSIRYKLGKNLTKGLGAGANSNVGKEAVEADREAITTLLEGADMVFITAGMGVEPVQVQLLLYHRYQESCGIDCRNSYSPFSFEGPKRMNRARKEWQK